MRTKLMYADQIFKDPRSINGDFLSGFNQRVMDHSYGDVCGYPVPAYAIGNLAAGYWKANDLIKSGDIYAMHTFPHRPCKGLSFWYGGHHVCNTCGQSGLAKPWWNICVKPDGNAFICMGEDFKNLQESDNYAFGDTREDAIENYYILMTTPKPDFELNPENSQFGVGA